MEEPKTRKIGHIGLLAQAPRLLPNARGNALAETRNATGAADKRAPQNLPCAELVEARVAGGVVPQKRGGTASAANKRAPQNLPCAELAEAHAAGECVLRKRDGTGNTARAGFAATLPNVRRAAFAETRAATGECAPQKRGSAASVANKRAPQNLPCAELVEARAAGEYVPRKRGGAASVVNKRAPQNLLCAELAEACTTSGITPRKRGGARNAARAGFGATSLEERGAFRNTPRRASKSAGFAKLGAVCAFLFCAALCAAQNAPYVIQSLDGALCLQECTLLICVPNCAPRAVSYTFADPPSGAKRVSLRKAVQSNGAQTDTLIEAVFVFDKAGSYEMPPLVIRADGERHSVELGAVTINENPRLMPPRAFWFVAGEDGLSQGNAAELELRVCFVEHIERIDVPLVEDALLEQIDEVSLDFVPVGNVVTSKGEVAARYSWTPLKGGEVALPYVKLSLTGTNGEERDVQVLGKTVKVANSNAGGYSSGRGAFAENIFAESFSAADGALNERAASRADAAYTALGGESLQSLAQLRSAERWSLLGFYTREQRIACEAEFGLDSAPDEPSVVQLLLCWGIFALVLLAAVLFLCWRKVVRGVLLLVLSSCLAAFCARTSLEVLPQGAVFAGGSICAVPDEDSQFVVALAPGSRVTVKKNTANWSLVQYEGRYEGWVQNGALALINRKAAKDFVKEEIKPKNLWQMIRQGGESDELMGDY